MHCPYLFEMQYTADNLFFTHLLFVGEVEDAERLSDETPLTYDCYHKVLKGKTPPKASSYQG